MVAKNKAVFRRKDRLLRRRLAGFLVLTILSLSMAEAGIDEKGADKAVVVVEKSEVFRDREWQVDLYGLGAFYQSAEGSFAGNLTGTGGNSRQFSGRPGWGLGMGASYFFLRYVGIGVEQDIFGRSDGGFRRGDFGYIRWATIGNLFLRYPIDAWRIAPYAMLGGGAMYGNTPDATINAGGGRRANYRLSGQGFGHVGGGLDFRFSRNVGVFSDLRYLFSGVSGLPDNQMLWRFGVRLAF